MNIVATCNVVALCQRRLITFQKGHCTMLPLAAVAILSSPSPLWERRDEHSLVRLEQGGTDRVFARDLSVHGHVFACGDGTVVQPVPNPRNTQHTPGNELVTDTLITPRVGRPWRLSNAVPRPGCADGRYLLVIALRSDGHETYSVVDLKTRQRRATSIQQHSVPQAAYWHSWDRDSFYMALGESPGSLKGLSVVNARTGKATLLTVPKHAGNSVTCPTSPSFPGDRNTSLDTPAVPSFSMDSKDAMSQRDMATHCDEHHALWVEKSPSLALHSFSRTLAAGASYACRFVEVPFAYVEGFSHCSKGDFVPSVGSVDLYVKGDELVLFARPWRKEGLRHEGPAVPVDWHVPWARVSESSATLTRRADGHWIATVSVTPQSKAALHDGSAAPVDAGPPPTQTSAVDVTAALGLEL